MKFKVKCLYERGVILPVEQLVHAASYTGNFVLEDQNHLNGSHMVRAARLLDPKVPNVQRDLIPPLFHAEVVGADENQMIVRGYSVFMNGQDIVMRLDKQCWALRLCLSE